MLSLENMVHASLLYRQATTSEERQAVDLIVSAQESLNDHFYPTLPQVPELLKRYIPQP